MFDVGYNIYSLMILWGLCYYIENVRRDNCIILNYFNKYHLYVQYNFAVKIKYAESLRLFIQTYFLTIIDSC